METVNFFTWIGVITAISLLAGWVMLWAYRGSGSVAILFPEPIGMVPISEGRAASTDQFQQGMMAYQKGKYRQSVEYLGNAIAADPTLAEAYHNRGLAFANLRQDNDAVDQLMKAGELYLQQGNQEAIALLKQHLIQLRNKQS